MTAAQETGRRGRGGFIDGLLATRRIILANFLREARARLGEGRFAYLRLLILHIATIAVFYIIRKVLNVPPPLPVDLFTAMSAGFFPFLLFQATLNGVSGSFDSNRVLLYYPGVRPLDFAFSFAMLEGATITVAFAIMLAVNYQFVPVPHLHDSLEVLMALISAWLLGSGVGLALMSLETLRPGLKTVVSIATRPLIFLSGVMYTATELPAAAVEILAWNPVFHLTEMAREGISSSYKSPIYDPLYLTYWIMGSWAIGLVLERYLRRNIRSA